MSKSYEKHIEGNTVFYCSMTAEERKEYCADKQNGLLKVQPQQTVPTSEMPYETRSPYKKCEVCGRPYLSFGKPCDHIDRRPGTRPMPWWIDNPVEWQMLCDRYDYVSAEGRFGEVSNGDGTCRIESL